MAAINSIVGLYRTKGISMTMLKNALVAVLLLTLMGCASGLNSMQKVEYQAYENAGVLIEEDDPTSAALFGLLPGGGSFYVGETGLGIVNLLFWPLSILWDPISGYQGAQVNNLSVTQYHIKNELEKEIAVLDDQLTLGQIDNKQYIVAKRKIEKKYAY